MHLSLVSFDWSKTLHHPPPVIQVWDIPFFRAIWHHEKNNMPGNSVVFRRKECQKHRINLLTALRDYKKIHNGAFVRMLSSTSIDTDQQVIQMFERLRIPEWVPQSMAMCTSRCEWDRVTEIMKNKAFHFDVVLGLLRDP